MSTSMSMSQLPIDDGKDTSWHSESIGFLTKMQMLIKMLSSLKNDLEPLDDLKRLHMLDGRLLYLKTEYQKVQHMETKNQDIWKSQPDWAYYSYVHKLRKQIAERNKKMILI